MSDVTPADNGYTAFTHHRRCALLQAWCAAESMTGAEAIRHWHPPEDQGSTAMQIVRPHDAWRVQWAREWDQARADYEAGKVEVEAAEC